MGLDMYLRAERYISPYPHNTEAAPLRKAIAAAINFKQTTSDDTVGKICGVSIQVAYWRKANQIHSWFVHNIQDGEDDCKKYFVSKDQLGDLIDVCQQVLKKQNDTDGKAFAEEHLPVSEGCFFSKGDEDYDEFYYQDLTDTIKMLSNLDAYGTDEFEYQASW